MPICCTASSAAGELVRRHREATARPGPSPAARAGFVWPLRPELGRGHSLLPIPAAPVGSRPHRGAAAAAAGAGVKNCSMFVDPVGLQHLLHERASCPAHQRGRACRRGSSAPSPRLRFSWRTVDSSMTLMFTSNSPWRSSGWTCRSCCVPPGPTWRDGALLAEHLAHHPQEQLRRSARRPTCSAACGPGSSSGQSR